MIEGVDFRLLSFTVCLFTNGRVEKWPETNSSREHLKVLMYTNCALVDARGSLAGYLKYRVLFGPRNINHINIIIPLRGCDNLTTILFRVPWKIVVSVIAENKHLRVCSWTHCWVFFIRAYQLASIHKQSFGLVWN